MYHKIQLQVMDNVQWHFGSRLPKTIKKIDQMGADRPNRSLETE